MAVDYDIKNENYNKNRRTGSDRPSYLLSSFTRAARVFYSSSHLLYLIYLDNWGRWKKGGKHLTVVRLQGQT